MSELVPLDTDLTNVFNGFDAESWDNFKRFWTTVAEKPPVEPEKQPFAPLPKTFQELNPQFCPDPDKKKKPHRYAHQNGRGRMCINVNCLANIGTENIVTHSPFYFLTYRNFF